MIALSLLLLLHNLLPQISCCPATHEKWESIMAVMDHLRKQWNDRRRLRIGWNSKGRKGERKRKGWVCLGVNDKVTKSGAVVGLLEKIAGCFKSLQFNVAEKALSLLDVNGGLGILIKENFKFVLQIVYPGLKEVTAKHWRPRTRELAVEISTVLKAIDPVFYDDCYIASLFCEEDEAGMEWMALARQERWTQLEGMAAARKDWSGLSTNFSQE
ncbi:hypothetical protein SLEP1_g6639 [Rubroshorea leprosula]|uniref:Uncharacterized protein n=1 Tax=Rubroshorea leprosula TaxID=152421 RepID=A0AAV5HVV3_9ROSI|nr:hypothetical protein SLEP1_g6639 [Rubroshorea leprosula]